MAIKMTKEEAERYDRWNYTGMKDIKLTPALKKLQREKKKAQKAQKKGK